MTQVSSLKLFKISGLVSCYSVPWFLNEYLYCNTVRLLRDRTVICVLECTRRPMLRNFLWSPTSVKHHGHAISKNKLVSSAIPGAMQYAKLSNRIRHSSRLPRRGVGTYERHIWQLNEGLQIRPSNGITRMPLGIRTILWVHTSLYTHAFQTGVAV